MRIKLFSIVIIAGLILPMFLLGIYFQHQKATIKRSVKRKMVSGLSHDQLVYLKFSKQEVKDNLNWIHDKEFELNNHMYDIVETKESADSIAYWCWDDNEEAAINKKLLKLYSLAINKNSENSNKQQWINSFCSSFYFVPEIINTAPKLNGSVFYRTQKVTITNIYFSVDLPPPRFS